MEIKHIVQAPEQRPSRRKSKNEKLKRGLAAGVVIMAAVTLVTGIKSRIESNSANSIANRYDYSGPGHIPTSDEPHRVLEGGVNYQVPGSSVEHSMEMGIDSLAGYIAAESRYLSKKGHEVPKITFGQAEDFLYAERSRDALAQKLSDESHGHSLTLQQAEQMVYGQTGEELAKQFPKESQAITPDAMDSHTQIRLPESWGIGDKASNK